MQCFINVNNVIRYHSEPPAFSAVLGKAVELSMNCKSAETKIHFGFFFFNFIFGCIIIKLWKMLQKHNLQDLHQCWYRSSSSVELKLWLSKAFFITSVLTKCKVCKVTEKDRPVRKCWLFEHVPKNMAWFCVFLILITNSKFALCQWKFQVSKEKPDSKRSWSLNIFEHKAARIYIHVHNDPQVIG